MLGFSNLKRKKKKKTERGGATEGTGVFQKRRRQGEVIREKTKLVVATVTCFFKYYPLSSGATQLYHNPPHESVTHITAFRINYKSV